MRMGRFEDSLKSINHALELLKITEFEAGTDVDVVKARFFLLKSNVNFVLKDYEAALESANEGMKSVDAVKINEI